MGPKCKPRRRMKSKWETRRQQMKKQAIIEL